MIACPRIRLFEIELESYFSSIPQYLLPTEYCTFLIAENFWELDPLRLNVRVISALYCSNVIAIYLLSLITGNCWKLDPLQFNVRVILAWLYLIAIYLSNCWKIWEIDPLKLNLRVISAEITVFIIQDLSDCWRFMRIRSSEIKCENNFSSLSQHNYLLNTFLIFVLGWLFY